MTQVFIDNDVKNHPWASIKIHAIVYVVRTDTVTLSVVLIQVSAVWTHLPQLKNYVLDICSAFYSFCKNTINVIYSNAVVAKCLMLETLHQRRQVY